MNDIFTNSDEVKKNISEGYKDLGVDVKQKTILVANKKCNFCWGRGLLIIHTPQKEIKQQYCKCVKIRRINE